MNGPGIGPVPAEVFHPVAGVSIDTDQLAVLIVAGVAAALLWWVIRKTRAGLEMRAVVDRSELAGLRGVNAARTSGLAWILTMILAGLGGILITPLFQLNDMLFTLVVLGSLAAVALGGLRSIPIGFIGGLLLGIIQNLLAGYGDEFLPKFLTQLSGFRASIPFILTLLLLFLVAARERGRRAGSLAEQRRAVRSPRGLAGVASPVAVGDLHRGAGGLLAPVGQCRRAAGGCVRAGHDRTRALHGIDLLVVRRAHGTGRHGEPRAGDVRHRWRVRRRLGADP